MFNSSVMILHMEMIILRMCKHLGENKTEMWFFHQLLQVHYFKMCWHVQLQTKFLTEIYTILYIKKLNSWK